MAPPDRNLLAAAAQRGSAALREYAQSRAGAGGAAMQAMQARGQVSNAFRGQPFVQPGSNFRGGSPDLMNQLYGMYQQSVLRRPAGPVVYGQVPDSKGKMGKYSGFQTQSDLWNAIEGRAYNLRAQGHLQATQARDTAGQKLGELSDEYDTSNLGAFKNAWADATAAAQDEIAANNRQLTGADRYAAGQAARAPGGGGLMGRIIGPVATVAQTVADAGKPQPQAVQDYSRYRGNLDNWLEQSAQPFTTMYDVADQIEATPLSELAQSAGADYGVDPYITAGRFGAKEDYSDWQLQRNLDAIASYGMPWSDVLSLQKQAESDLTGQQKEADAAQLEQIGGLVYDQTGMDASQLASSADLTVPQLGMVVASPEHQQASSVLQEILASATSDPAAAANDFTRTVQQIGYQDPQLYRVLMAEYADYAPSGYDFYTEPDQGA